MDGVIVRIKFGSHLYGTATQESDLDFKQVRLPSAREILLGRTRHVVTENTKQGEGKNTAGDVDVETFTLQQFLKLCAEGQTVAIDMLFARPDPPANGLWSGTIIGNRNRILSRKPKAFLGYCRQQAAKYGIKGSRVAAARAALQFARDLGIRCGWTTRLGDAESEVRSFAENVEHCAVVETEQPGKVPARHLEVCNRKAPFLASIQNLHDIVERLVFEYGQRALLAERNEGVDWKALSHAVRVGNEAIELLKTGQITFPRPERAHLIAIKSGAVPYAQVAAEIELLLEGVETAAACSELPTEADLPWIDEIVMTTNLDVVRRNFAA